MHELALMESLVSTVIESVPDARVLTIRLEVGRLAGAVPDALRFCFDLCTEGTPLQGARLEIIDCPAIGCCAACQKEVALGTPPFFCPCGSIEVGIVSGQQLRVSEVEVA